MDLALKALQEEVRKMYEEEDDNGMQGGLLQGWQVQLDERYLLPAQGQPRIQLQHADEDNAAMTARLQMLPPTAADAATCSDTPPSQPQPQPRTLQHTPCHAQSQSRTQPRSQPLPLFFFF